MTLQSLSLGDFSSLWRKMEKKTASSPCCLSISQTMSWLSTRSGEEALCEYIYMVCVWGRFGGRNAQIRS